MTTAITLDSFHATADRLIARGSWGMLIDGKIVSAADGRTYATHSPADGRLLGYVPLASVQDVMVAVAAGKAAARSWRDASVQERVRVVRTAIAALREHAVELGVLDSLDSGNPASAMVQEVEMACEWLEYCCGAATSVVGETLPSRAGQWLMTHREPYGVVVRITAYNHPILFAAQKLGAPLVTGNTLILKVPEQTPLAALRMGEILCDVFPAGVLAILPGKGSVAGDALVRHPDVKRISLIGSVETGKRVQIAAAETGIKHLSLELGGKNPMVIFPDVGIEEAAQAAVRGMNYTRTQGQSCGSCSRVFVHEDIYDAVVERIADLAQNIRIGDPLDPTTEMGCMISEREWRRVMDYIEQAPNEGARLVTGGNRPEHLQSGWFIAPTVFADVTSEMRIAHEEIFGPVMSVLRWRDEEELLSIIGSVALGLTSSVWTNDLTAAMRLADRIDSGYVWINDAAAHYAGAPFSGHADSGIGTEEGLDELFSFTQVKTVAMSPLRSTS